MKEIKAQLEILKSQIEAYEKKIQGTGTQAHCANRKNQREGGKMRVGGRVVNGT